MRVPARSSAGWVCVAVWLRVNMAEDCLLPKLDLASVTAAACVKAFAAGAARHRPHPDPLIFTLQCSSLGKRVPSSVT